MLSAALDLEIKMALIYKILSREIWTKAQKEGVFHGAAIDLTDGYIHLSTVAQAEETARRHFAGQDDLVLVAFDSSDFAENLRWEPSTALCFPTFMAALPLQRRSGSKTLC